MIPTYRQFSRMAARPTAWPPGGAPSPGGTEGMIIHYDHTATFELKGRPGNVAQDVINVGSDGVFVATATGYGFEEQRARPINNPAAAATAAAVAAALAPAPATSVTPGDFTLGQLPLASLIEGFRISPRFAPLVFTPAPNQAFSEQPIAFDLFFGSLPDRSVLEKVKTPEDISFFFSIVDSGSGREFQDQPAHNLASLGKSNGERPFRLLARPLSFLPRSTLRLQIAERTEGAQGTLFIVLYGYKILGAAACPEPVVRSWGATPQGCPVETFGEVDARAIPFDYVTTFELTGNPGNLVEDEISVNVEGGFMVTSIGYGLSAEERDVELDVPSGIISSAPAPGGGTRKVFDLAQLPLRAFPSSALLDGVRIRSNFLRVALGVNGILADQFPLELA